MISITRGDDYIGTRRLVITVTDEAGDPVDLTGTAATFMAKLRRTDTDVSAVISVDVALDADQTANKGKAYIPIAGSDTDQLDAGAYYYEIQATDSIGVITLAAGRLNLVADLIRG